MSILAYIGSPIIMASKARVNYQHSAQIFRSEKTSQGVSFVPFVHNIEPYQSSPSFRSSALLQSKVPSHLYAGNTCIRLYTFYLLTRYPRTHATVGRAADLRFTSNSHNASYSSCPPSARSEELTILEKGMGITRSVTLQHRN